MKIEFLETGDSRIAELISDDIEIRNPQQALDLMMDCAYQGAESLIIHEHNLAPEFFDLKTGLAGKILQKFSNYRMRLAIVGNFGKYPGKSLKDFIYESNKGGRIYFVDSAEHARKALSRK